MAEVLRNVQLERKRATTLVKTDLKDGDVFRKQQSVLNPLKNITPNFRILLFTHPQIITYEEFKKNCKVGTKENSWRKCSCM
ncbi:hypothetical protein SAMN05421542_2744 [Chryseobacterium jejuense]|uniref:Uncharacterized protein n=1 Tax=Chryseobacterium jejuense TaxID=445960 RepID=A0A2X2VHF9_CHRJE|nr:hypothetical protein SAMN05421542_2744 [Chryseobacterium jejuense]SQB27978.1 Uncharacterised protein [Chryseobacterium jejuense]